METGVPQTGAPVFIYRLKKMRKPAKKIEHCLILTDFT